MRLLLVRHGETTSNIDGRVQSAWDPLTDLWYIQAKKVAERLGNYSFDVIYTSTQVRCKETAYSICQYHQETPLREDSLLEEIHRWIYAGQRRTEEIDQILQRNNISLIERTPQGESIVDVAQRAYTFIQHIIAQHSDQTILVIGHSWFFKQLEIIFDKRDLQDINIMKNVWNASISEREYTDTMRKNIIHDDRSFL